MTVTLITDVAAINVVFRASFADPSIDVSTDLANPKCVALDHDYGLIVYKPLRFAGQYHAWTAIKSNWTTQADVISIFDECHDWAFRNSDAVLIEGDIPSSDTGLIAAVEKTQWTKITYRVETVHAYAPIGQWAKAKGFQAAVDLLNANGWTQKAQKLRTAAGL